jgi:DNA repair photolyase
MNDEFPPIEKRVGRTSLKRPRGRVILPSEWIGQNVIVANKDRYVAILRGEHLHSQKRDRNLSIVKDVFEQILNNRSNGRKMFNIVTETWNPVTGCLHHCIYCWARNLANTKLKNSHRYKDGFNPSLNETEFRKRFKDGDFVFVSDMGDLFGDFIPRNWIIKVLERIKQFPKTHFLILTKNPGRFEKFLEVMPKNVILGATLETNRDNCYLENTISRAALPSLRYNAMKNLEWDKKFISVEPILDFDLEIFSDWLQEISPFMIYVGYDNYRNNLPEPLLGKTLKLLKKISEEALVVKKSIRCAWFEGLKGVIYDQKK